MQGIIKDILIAIVYVASTALLIYLIWGPEALIPAPSPDVQELRAEINRLKPYEEFMRQTNVVITYNGCEDIRKRLGLIP